MKRKHFFPHDVEAREETTGMNYDLALKLKNAGYPQTGRYYYYGEESVKKYHPMTDWYIGPPPFGHLEGDIVKPTLSELIEACGDRFNSLNSNSITGFDSLSFDGSCGAGNTPEEAVANLWLSIHDKTNQK